MDRKGREVALLVVGWILLASLTICSSPYSIQPLGVMKAPHAAFLTLFPRNITAPSQPSDCVDLFVSSFGALEIGSVGIVPCVGSKLISWNDTLPPKSIFPANWPNAVSPLPTSLRPSAKLSNDDIGIVFGNGFLIPFHSTGALNLAGYHSGQPKVVPISLSKSGWFYHRGSPILLPDSPTPVILTARAIKPLVYGEARGEMILLSPQHNRTPYHEIVLLEGPDFFLSPIPSSLLQNVANGTIYDPLEVTLTPGDTLYVFSAQYFAKQLTVSWYEGNIMDPSHWKQATIDTYLQNLFAASLVDMNGDGKLDLLVTNHVPIANLSSVAVYEIPSSPKDVDGYKRHIIAHDFPTYQKGRGQASPGGAIPFCPKSPCNKPWIALSGDGNQQAYQLRPRSSDPSDWEYTVERIVNVHNTVGMIAVADVDMDGYSEVFVPNYDDGLIYAYTYRPSP